jgi:hypothetical protein
MFRHRDLFCSVLALAFSCMMHPTAASAKPAQEARPGITVSAPEGFADLTEDRTLVVDVFFGGARIGEALVAVAPGNVRFLDVAGLVALLPRLSDSKAVEAALSATSLPANANLVCTSSADPRTCGRLSPEQVGVIFDRERFRIDIFLNSRLLEVREEIEDRYLPPPEPGLSMINAVSGTVSGRTDGGSQYYNVQDQLVVGSGNRRIRADMSVGSEVGLGVERLTIEWDRPERRFRAGALWAPGSGLAGQRKLVGAGIESQIDTRRDRDSILGSPVIVFLDRRARVDVVRDGRVLGSWIHEAGNQKIDTSSLPEGSYEILLRIQEAGQAVREERRFYTKSRQVPSDGRTNFFVYGGLLVKSPETGSIEPSDRPFVQGGIARRLAAGWAFDGTLQATDEFASLEFGTTVLTPVAIMRAAALVDTVGAHGIVMQVSSSGISPLNFSVDFRQIENGDVRGAGSLLLSDLSARRDAGFDLADFRPRTDYTQLGGIVSYSLANVRLLGALFYRDDAGRPARYSLGPSLEWDILRKKSFMVTVRGDLTVTEQGSSGFAGISLRLLDRSSTMTAVAGRRTSGRDGDPLGDGAVGSVSGVWNFAAAGGELAVGAGAEHQPRQQDFFVSSELRHPLGSLRGNVLRSIQDSDATTQYAAAFQTTLAAGAGSLRVAGRTTTESMIIASVSGAREEDRFELLVDEQVAGTIEGEGQLAVALPAYRAYHVRIRPIGKDLVSYDSSSREIGLHPGSLTRLSWTAAPMTIKFGRLIDPDGRPIAGAAMTGKGVWSQTDDNGYFQIEIPEGEIVRITLQDGQTFAIELPSAGGGKVFADIGQMVCCDARVFMAGALDSNKGAFRGDSR